ncbi:outer membrane protein W [Luminiphilus syltensis NOR5-1B]|uniref:Outer membrane protein W n=1 Tax=Luminiphilus syltensis NOR5-1B TaxID=565045 RepID=B8KWM7_9GAMM|nr:OmpW family outer membrane protein [Luminiphilus syltensis]EED35901.1 outer membrane protein W [Luminiphilus syltensis NOR5-1B]
MKTLFTTLTIASATLLSAPAFAYEPGDFFVRAGAAMVDPNGDSDPIAIPGLGLGPIPDTSVDVDDDTQLGLTATYMFTANLGLELLASTPFKHDISADLGGAGLGTAPVGDTKHLPPTVSAVWYIAGSTDAFKPYLGVGINYTTFFSESVSGDLEALVGDLAGAGGPVPLEMELDDSLGVAFTAGFDYAIDAQWHLNASVRWIEIDTEAEITNRDLGTIITVDSVDIDPWVYQINVGYSF